MTYASDLGLKVGSKIRVIDSNPNSSKDMYNHNDILLFVEDTGDKGSKFHNLTTGDDNCWFTFQDRTNCTMTWEHYKEPVKATPKLVWKEMTLEEVKAVQVGDKIRIDGEETEIVYTYNKEYDFGFDISPMVSCHHCSTLGTDRVLGMQYKFEKLVEETEMNTRLERDREYDVKLTGEQLAWIYLYSGQSHNSRGVHFLVADMIEDEMGMEMPSPICFDADSNSLDKHVVKDVTLWLDKVFTVPETEDQRKLRELKEQYESLGKAIDAMEKK